MEKKVICEIQKIFGAVELIENVGCFFMLNGNQCIYMDNKDSRLLKFSIPCLMKVSVDTRLHVANVVNQANREIKYVKTLLLDNNCVSLVYERRIDKRFNEHIVSHITAALDFASKYIKQKIAEK